MIKLQTLLTINVKEIFLFIFVSDLRRVLNGHRNVGVFLLEVFLKMFMFNDENKKLKH